MVMQPLTFIMRDKQRRVQFIASKLIKALSSYKAKLKALEWGFGLANDYNWSKVCWSSDALVVVHSGKRKMPLTFIMRDKQRRVQFIASKLIKASSFYEAKLKALEWGFGLANDYNWSKVCWSSDALVVVHSGKRKMVDFVIIMNETVNEFIYIDKLTDKDGRLWLDIEFWNPSPSDWYKINPLTFIMRDKQRRVQFIASKLIKASSSYEAKLKALEWGFGLANDYNWSKVCWSSDALVVVNKIFIIALVVVNKILSLKDPVSGDDRHITLFCRSLLRKKDWLLSWNARSSNKAANLLAKESLKSNVCFLFLILMLLFMFCLVIFWTVFIKMLFWVDCNSLPL
ncbi:hypothetical protein FNV43_RR01646 [Rhamnella rubrinervis]|uniref:RNase H type-1 domain-containing protein n=1 Tax=Rhamnella rubrinervis TaxID=2594499 RepID=A0A8K0HSU4_9ROSA|nr:hypothetical protein FNV43_RR01646 [Rhamnella rubrinervis]